MLSKRFPVRRNSAKEKGTALILGITSLCFVIPAVGLSVDVGFLYANKARLQASVDGAALAAARALNLGETTAAQASAAQQNAVNWFYANSPVGNWNTFDVDMDVNDVAVFDDPNNPNLRIVDLSASLSVPTYFMNWFNIGETRISAAGTASRRDAVIMMVLDRSGSMNDPPGACNIMKQAAKIFTGQFANGRDRIGLVSYGSGTYLHSAPTTNFRSVLGYSDAQGSGNGSIDNIVCGGGTSTAQAVSLAYEELRKINLPGALNIIMLETDGLPNTLTINLWDNSTNTYGLQPQSYGNGCDDNNNLSLSENGWGSYSVRRRWINFNMNYSFLPSTAAGTVGALYKSDPSQGRYFFAMMDPFDEDADGYDWLSTRNCRWGSNGGGQNMSDLAWVPATDIWGNELNPALNRYKPVTMNGTHVWFEYNSNFNATWTNYNNAVFNATDNAAYRARAVAAFPIGVFVIGLGGQGSDDPDLTLLQRMANDDQGDRFGSPAAYGPCADNPDCVHYNNQLTGTFVFSNNTANLRQAFLLLSSQILRLSN